MNLDLIKEIENLRKRIEILEAKFHNGTTDLPRKRVSAREFLLSARVEDGVQKTLLLAYFLEKNEGLASFTVKDLERTFMMAKERIPTNTNDLINKNISKGFLMEAQEKKENKKAWCLTNSGENNVETSMLQLSPSSQIIQKGM